MFSGNMNIQDILKTKYKNVDFIKDIILQDDGQGVYIKEWNIPNEVKPDRATLDQWAIEVQAEFKAQEKQHLRKEAYLAQNIDNEALIVALWEKYIENRPEAADSIQTKRLAIKNEIR